MLKNERMREILNILKNKNGFVSVSELCRELYASESSIRRDLSTLESKGLIERNYGGAELKNNYSVVRGFSERASHDVNSKMIIAKKAAGIIKDGSVIFMDQSSSAYYLAKEITKKKSLTVITNNTAILNILAPTQFKIISSGGILSSKNRVCLMGGDACRCFGSIYADYAFFSVKSITNDGVLFDCDREEVIVRNTMIKNAKEKIFLCGSEKINTRSPYRQCTLNDVDYLICENENGEFFKNSFCNLRVIK